MSDWEESALPGGTSASSNSGKKFSCQAGVFTERKSVSVLRAPVSVFNSQNEAYDNHGKPPGIETGGIALSKQLALQISRSIIRNILSNHFTTGLIDHDNNTCSSTSVLFNITIDTTTPFYRQ
ncbi:hypothetical protein ACJJI3_10575 [Microbulbifer sp. ZKSA004]|uniref:hypothetical protein n=1 Tax=Microbulbifer sp. ZKSA004 TaxID=3243389 RepID=UPI004039B055